MRKLLLVLCVVMVGSLVASAQLVSPTVYDRTFYGFCNGEHMVLQKLAASGTGHTKTYVAGYEDLTSACGFPYNAPTVGQKHGVSPSTPPHDLNGLAGPVLDIADAGSDAVCVCFSGTQEEFLMDIRDSLAAGFISFLGYDGDYFFGDVSLVNGLPSKVGNAAGKPTFAGTFKTNHAVKK